MNTKFNFNRFAKLLSYDLRRSVQDYGRNYLVLILMPLMFCLIYSYFPLIYKAGIVEYAGMGGRITVLFCAILAMVLTFPVRVYGALTEKNFGSNYLMLPASTMEKFCSMILVNAVIVPLAVLAGFFAVDSLLAAAGLFRGGLLFPQINESVFMTNEYVRVNVWIWGFISIAFNMLVFLLGAIYFKKGKVAATVLALLVVSFVVSFAFTDLFTWISGTDEFMQISRVDFDIWLEANIDKLNLYANLIFSAYNLIRFLIVGGLIYLRLKTLKH